MFFKSLPTHTETQTREMSLRQSFDYDKVHAHKKVVVNTTTTFDTQGT